MHFNLKQFTIYIIKDPLTLEPVYVGSTSDYKNRIGCHWGVKNNSAISHYMQKLRKKGVKPIFVEHCVCNYNNKFREEAFLIEQLLKEGKLLLNTAYNLSENKNLALQKYLYGTN